MVLVPAILGWPYGRLDPTVRKAFEVVLHLGSATGLVVALRSEVAEVVRSLDASRIAWLILATAPATCTGFFLRRPVEEQLGAPRRVAAAQVAAGAALWLADRRPADRERIGLADALAVGLAQAAALAPGVSRGGASLTVLRLRRLRRATASSLSRHAAAPIVLGAAALEAAQLARRGLPGELRPAFAAGAAAACCSSVAAAGFVPAIDGARSYAPLAGYRIAAGLTALWRLPKARGRRPVRLNGLHG